MGFEDFVLTLPKEPSERGNGKNILPSSLFSQKIWFPKFLSRFYEHGTAIQETKLLGGAQLRPANRGCRSGPGQLHRPSRYS